MPKSEKCRGPFGPRCFMCRLEARVFGEAADGSRPMVHGWISVHRSKPSASRGMCALLLLTLFKNALVLRSAVFGLWESKAPSSSKLYESWHLYRHSYFSSPVYPAWSSLLRQINTGPLCTIVSLTLGNLPTTRGHFSGSFPVFHKRVLPVLVALTAGIW